jgi:hypothetical protein
MRDASPRCVSGRRRERACSLYGLTFTIGRRRVFVRRERWCAVQQRRAARARLNNRRHARRGRREAAATTACCCRCCSSRRSRKRRKRTVVFVVVAREQRVSRGRVEAGERQTSGLLRQQWWHRRVNTPILSVRQRDRGRGGGVAAPSAGTDRESMALSATMCEASAVESERCTCRRFLLPF